MRYLCVSIFFGFCEEAPLDPWVTSEEDEIVRSDSPGKHQARFRAWKFDKPTSLRPANNFAAMLSRRLPANRDISVSGVRGEPEPETVNHRTKLTPSSLCSPLASLHTPYRRTNRFMDPNVPPSSRSVTQTLSLSLSSNSLVPSSL